MDLPTRNQSRGFAWQETPDGRQPVAAAFRLDGEQVRFEIGAYDPGLPLTIDPVVLLYAGFLGGSTLDQAYSIAVDAAGNAYITGYTYSTQATFPITTGPDLTYNSTASSADAFVAKVNAAGTGLVYAGFLGGSGYDVGYAIAVDSAGNAYVTGTTESVAGSLPTKAGPDLSHNGGFDAFVTKIDPTGTTFVYSGFSAGPSTK